jgi:uncharacterized secreted protein with C-terminal beta-propeller domain
MKRSIMLLVLALLVSGLIVPLYFEGFVVMARNRLKRFFSYEELRNFVRTSYPYYYYIDGAWGLLEARTLGGDTDLNQLSISQDYSKTNIQVEGVDEGDIVKTDGEYIYHISGKNVTILKAYPPEDAEILSQIKLNGIISSIYVNGNKLTVFEGIDNAVYYEILTPAIVIPEVKPYPYYVALPTITIRIYDVSDRANPVQTRNVTLEGSYFASRMIGDYVYAVVNERIYANETWVALPKIYSNGELNEIKATEIYHSSISDYYNAYTTVLAINTQDDAQEPTSKTILLGSASSMYVSMNNIYITFQGYIGEQFMPIFSRTKTTPVSAPVWGTNIHRVAIENGNIEIGPSGSVIGNVLNQFSMDEYNGYFRIATTNWGQAGPENNVYVLDMDLNIVGRLEKFAPQDETMDSARFIGDRCYLATSVIRRDPFFVIDLADSTEPKVLGYLKIPGFTRYLHPYDENHIIGVGKDGNVVKISLFDVSNVSKPIEIDKYTINGTWSDTPVLNEHKAFLFSKVKNLLAFPVSVHTKGTVWQGGYVFSITLPEGFVFRGKITNLPYHVDRLLYIDNVLYTISSKKIKMNSLEDLAEINEIELP